MIRINVYDVLEKEVATIVNWVQNSGSCKVNFDSSKLSSGTYFYRIKAGTFSETKKLLLLK